MHELEVRDVATADSCINQARNCKTTAGAIARSDHLLSEELGL